MSFACFEEGLDSCARVRYVVREVHLVLFVRDSSRNRQIVSWKESQRDVMICCD